jgi:hypothetical protein
MLAIASVEAQVIINEIHYDPEPDTAALEFIELFNRGASSVDLSGWYFSDGVEYDFPSGSSIAAGGYLVIAQDPTSIESTFGVTALGPWSGKLSNEGEEIVLRDALDAKVDTLDYQRGFPWPVCPDGTSMELLHPYLDRGLGGSWRSSAYSIGNEEVVCIAASAIDWRYFKGTEEASSPSSAWRAVAFDDSGWLTGQTSLGYGDDDDNTTLSDMKNGYSSVYLRKTFNLNASEIPSSLLLRIYVDDGAVVWINGTEVARVNVPDGELAYDTVTGAWLEASWTEVVVSGSTLTAGTNVVAVHAVNQALDSSDFSIDLELRSNSSGASLLPSPGEQNRVWTAAAPPASRQVEHVPEQPVSGEPVVVSTKVTDPDGVGSVFLEYQSVAPGAYVRASDEGYADGWTALAMTDDGSGGDEVAGDDVYSATIPGGVQLHRHLVRYRITVSDADGVAQQVPYEDDARLNFAYFVYDGVPAWTGANDPDNQSPESTFSTNIMAKTMPVYHLLALEDDVLNCQYTNAYKDVRFYGTFVYDGQVYDHIQFKVRGEYSTYKSGKNKWRFYFNQADDFKARDNYGDRYEADFRRLNLNACASPWVPVNRGMAGLDEAGSFRLNELAGVASPKTHYAQLRVIDAGAEAPEDQYAGDLWGLYLSVEHIDGRFLEEHGLPDGNTYKISGASSVTKRNQSATQSEDDSDWTAFQTAIASNSEGDWRTCFDLETYYTFRGINRVVSNVDLRYYTNYGMYHHPDGHWYMVPQDLDMMFAPETHWAGAVAMEVCLNHAEIENEFKNRCRELLDLLFSDVAPMGGQGVQVLHELAQWVNPTNQPLTFADVDQFMWNYHPRASTVKPIHRGQFYISPVDDTRKGGTWTRTLVSADFEGFVQYITDFITDTDPDSFSVGDGDQRGYGFNYLELEATDSDIPDTPTLTYTGTDGYPVDGLQFTSSAFADPQGAGTFGALEWRIAEIRNPASPGYEAGDRWKYEIEADWESGEIVTQSYSINPATDLVAGRTYRARVRHQDNTSRWSHWSAPVEFVAMGREMPLALMLSEVHYNPAEPEAGSGYDADDFEFVELVNNGAETLDLRGYALDGGIEFTFRGSAVETLAAGEYVVVVRNAEAFATRYDVGDMPIAGTYSGKLSNSGENVRLEYYGQKLFDISYNDSRGWPLAADGGGHSLIPLNDDIAEQGFDILDYSGNWRASTYEHGSPGEADPAPMDDLLINEIIAHTDTGYEVPYDSNDQIELYNPTSTDVTLDGHWYLSDDVTNPEQFNIPVGAVIPAGGWLLFDEDDFHPGRVDGFGLDKVGEQVVLSHRPGSGMNRVVDGFEFEGQANAADEDDGATGGSWGRYPDGDAFLQNLSPTPDGANQLPLPGIRIEQLMYHPASISGVEMDDLLEYVLLTNRSSQTIALEDLEEGAGSWRIDGGIDYRFETGFTLSAGAAVWLVPFDPSMDASSKTLFCTTYGIDEGTILMLGPYEGNLSNAGESITLERPQASDDPQAPDEISWIIVDEAVWLDESPWPEDADGTGYALLRTGSCGNDPLSWTTTDDRDSDGLSDRWEMGFRTNLTDLGAGDYDGDGANDKNEYQAGTDPTDASSLFEFKSIKTVPNTLLSWSSATGKVYSLWVSTDLVSSSFTNSGVQLPATPPLNTYTVEVDQAESAYFQLRVEEQ